LGRAFQTFGTFGTLVIDPFAAPIANAMRMVVQAITIARVQRLVLAIDIGCARVGFIGSWRVCGSSWCIGGSDGIAIRLSFFGIGWSTASDVDVEHSHRKDDESQLHCRYFVINERIDSNVFSIRLDAGSWYEYTYRIPYLIYA
jgi:hypothetical protein